MRAVHYIAGLRAGTVQWLPGWPCCCSGDRAFAIVQFGAVTRWPAEVTCKNCLAQIARANKLATPPGPSSEEE